MPRLWLTHFENDDYDDDYTKESNSHDHDTEDNYNHLPEVVMTIMIIINKNNGNYDIHH